ncbi:MAG: hypothetical protein A3D74_02915 [Candidatus Levybacteria bacterium RIFCSPHIGHO2_02_FULL_37_13]|nr:MAG: hypothetical protein A3D74_02915 [Candidatus Levybacteria bacterium RIFCSPHIGHO2_02_FULL_37_13]OGH40143.1 MAG: hypothetical protein A3B41_04805 [Candidatus Levybacteria bacterium RIFCSPLOWO2_01_FULL_37_26]
MSRKFSSVLVFSLLSLVFGSFIVFSPSALAHHQARVLGDSTSSSEIVFPPVTAGAGFILPDSPLFFLDRVFQDIRLLMAFTPERRAKTRALIAGERLAELRIMFARNNPEAVTDTLSKLTEEINKMSKDLSDAASSGKEGKDLSLLASQLNETIKAHRKVLGTLESQSDGVLKLQIKTARNALKIAKIEIEDELTEDELENEIEDDVDEEVQEAVEEASGSARRLNHAIDVLSQLASQAAAKQQTRREEALRHAIEVKNEALRRQTEKLFEEESIKHRRILEMRAKAHEKAREAIEKAHEAAAEFGEAQEEIKDLESEDNSSSGSENSGSSGSDNSGSGSSGSSGSGRSGNDDED